MKIPVKKNSVICLCAALCFTVLRILQILFCTDAVTGFFKSGYADLGTEISIVIFVFLLFSFIFSFTEKKVPKNFPKNSLSLSIGSILLSGFIIADLIFLPETYSAPVWQTVFFYLTGIITVLLLLFSGLSFFNLSQFFNQTKISPVFSVVPLIFIIVRTIICFSFYTELAILSETVFLFSAIICLLFLLLYISFLVNGIEPVKTPNRLLPLFTISILCCLNASLPQLILYLFGFKESIHDLNINNFTFFGVLIYLIILYFNLFNDENMKERVKKHAKEASIFKH